MTFTNLEFRMLRKLKILSYLNISKRIVFADRKIVVPIINSLGYPNLFLKPSWLCLLINEFVTNDGETIIDVGANIGQTLIAVKAARNKIQYIGFEPSVSCCFYLKMLIEVNNFDNCYIYNLALSDKLKKAFLETNVEGDPTGSMIENLRPDFFSKREPILSLNYDSLNLSQNVVFVKIDVEGGELEVLKGMRNLITHNRPYIICEILDSFSDDVLTFTQNRANQVCDILKEENYSIIQLVQNEKNDKITSFNEIDNVNIKQWEKSSFRLNDYIFFPTNKQNIVREILFKLCTLRP